jgi:hypothetical protein
MSFLDGKSLMRLALANHQFHAMVMEERLWKALCVRELGLPLGVKWQSEFSWRNLYGAATGMKSVHVFQRKIYSLSDFRFAFTPRVHFESIWLPLATPIASSRFLYLDPSQSRSRS